MQQHEMMKSLDWTGLALSKYNFHVNILTGSLINCLIYNQRYNFVYHFKSKCDSSMIVLSSQHITLNPTQPNMISNQVSVVHCHTTANAISKMVKTANPAIPYINSPQY